MAMPKERVVKTFDKCPVCGSERRFAGDAAKKEAEEGRMKIEEGQYAGLWELGGPIMDEMRVKAGLVIPGSIIPIKRAVLDACSECGCVYTVAQISEESILHVGVRRSGS